MALMHLLRQCDAVLSCGAVDATTKGKWIALRAKATGSDPLANIFGL